MASKTDNSHLGIKVDMRERAVRRLGKAEVSVLDAYHGTGRIWNAVRRRMPDVVIDVLGVDTRDMGPGVIRADNRRVLESLDLEAFDLIDLDAYGVPTQQLATVVRKAPDVPVFVTCIKSNLAMPHAIMGANSLPAGLKSRNPVLTNRLWLDLWPTYLHHLGYRHWEHAAYRDGIGWKFYDTVWR